MAAAALLAAPYCDAVEVNVGCPQRCAKKGGYGAFLMSRPSLLCEIVAAMRRVLPSSIPVLCKIRVFEDAHETLKLARKVEQAGCGCVTVHGRTREQGGGRATGRVAANWDTIMLVKRGLVIPVVSNGNISTLEHVYSCLEYTRCDAVMSGCGILADPAIFAGGSNSAAERLRLASEYCELAILHSARPKQVRTHLCDILDQLLPGLVTLQKLDSKFIRVWVSMQKLAEPPSERIAVTGARLRAEIMGFKGREGGLESLITSINLVGELLLELGLLDLSNDELSQLGIMFRRDQSHYK